jgi:hypothetical protein
MLTILKFIESSFVTFIMQQVSLVNREENLIRLFHETSIKISCF